MKNKSPYLILVTGIFCGLIIALVYYQMVQKPSLIKKVCEDQALLRSVHDVSADEIPETNQRGIIQDGLESEYYETCVVINS